MRLEVADLRVQLQTDDGPVLAVNGVSFGVAAGEVLALVGESGCGKSMTALSILDLLPANATRAGRIVLDERDLTALAPKQMRAMRGRAISMIFQEPMTSLNPAFTVGFQIAEVLRQHERLSRRRARERAIELLDRVGIPSASRRVDEYPHQLSGGMRQRAMIAMAVACNPRVLIADEPTTALDVTIQAQILDILRELQSAIGASIIMITHDLGVVADIARRVIVMYAGHMIESGPVEAVFASPLHPYTIGLLGAVPRRAGAQPARDTRLQEIPGLVPTLREAPTHCVFAARCPRASATCWRFRPEFMQHGPDHWAACFHPGPTAAAA